MFFLQTNSLAYRDYIPAKLSTGKEWYIFYYAMDPKAQKLKRIRIKVNRIPIKVRKKESLRIVADINSKLELGWNPLIEASAPRAYAKLGQVLDDFIAVKTKELEEGSMRCYRSYVKIFREWAAQHGIKEDTYVFCINHSVALEFMNSIDRAKNKSARTYNNYLRFFQILFDWMKGKGYVDENPFSRIGLKPKKLTQKNRRVFTDKELAVLYDYLIDRNPHYLLAAMLCYCCFIRPKELALLKCSDIDLKKQIVHIRAEIAKNDKASTRTIPDQLMPLLKRADWSHPNWYLFASHDAYDFAPGPVQVSSRKLAKYWQDHIRVACGFGLEIKFYGLKDTGITNMLNTGVPINLVRQQADHSSIAMTSIYVGKKEEATETLKKARIITKKKTNKG